MNANHTTGALSQAAGYDSEQQPVLSVRQQLHVVTQAHDSAQLLAGALIGVELLCLAATDTDARNARDCDEVLPPLTKQYNIFYIKLCTNVRSCQRSRSTCGST